MELEAIRAVYAGLTDPTIGINAMIDGLVKDTVTDNLPAHVTVYNYVDHPWVARKKLNKDEIENGHVSVPAVAVFLARPAAIDAKVQTVHRNGDFPIVVAYFTTEPDETKRMRDALYVNRAMLRFLTKFDDNANATMRFRNNVNLFTLQEPVTQTTPFVPWEAAILSAATEFTYHCREHLP